MKAVTFLRQWQWLKTIVNTWFVVPMFALGVAVSPMAAQAADWPVSVAMPIFVPMTGPQATYGPPMSDGARLAVAEINAHGGIGGKTRIDLHIVDTEANPQKAVIALRREYDRYQMPFALTSFSSTILAQLPVAKKINVPLINGGAQSDMLGGQTPYLWNVIPLIDTEEKALTDYLVGNGYKTAAIIATNDAAGKSAADDFEKHFKAKGGKILGRQDAPYNENDFLSQITLLKATGADVLYNGAFGDPGNIIINQVRQLGWNVQIADTSWIDRKIIQNPNAENLIYTTMPLKPSKEFLESYKKLTGKSQLDGSFVATYYDGVKAFAAAFEYAQKNFASTTGSDIMRALPHVRFDSAYGVNVGFDEEGVIQRPISIGQLRGGAEILIEP